MKNPMVKTEKKQPPDYHFLCRNLFRSQQMKHARATPLANGTGEKALGIKCKNGP
jgi:hypothetical protein